MVIEQSLPSHFPLEKPAFFMYEAARAGSPVGVLDEVELRALRARGSARLIEPGNPGRDEVRRDLAPTARRRG